MCDVSGGFVILTREGDVIRHVIHLCLSVFKSLNILNVPFFTELVNLCIETNCNKSSFLRLWRFFYLYVVVFFWLINQYLLLTSKNTHREDVYSVYFIRLVSYIYFFNLEKLILKADLWHFLLNIFTSFYICLHCISYNNKKVWSDCQWNNYQHWDRKTQVLANIDNFTAFNNEQNACYIPNYKQAGHDKMEKYRRENQKIYLQNNKRTLTNVYYSLWSLAWEEHIRNVAGNRYSPPLVMAAHTKCIS